MVCGLGAIAHIEERGVTAPVETGIATTAKATVGTATGDDLSLGTVKAEADMVAGMAEAGAHPEIEGEAPTPVMVTDPEVQIGEPNLGVLPRRVSRRPTRRPRL
jgi:hypothetical protein